MFCNYTQSIAESVELVKPDELGENEAAANARTARIGCFEFPHVENF
jgi:hypothetical protein